jgi:hypothetical protein
LKEQYPEKKAVGRPQLQYLKQVARYSGADNYAAMQRTACSKSRWKAANQSKDWRIRRRRRRRIIGESLVKIIHQRCGCLYKTCYARYGWCSMSLTPLDIPFHWVKQ